MSGTASNHVTNHSRIFSASLLNGSVSSKRADLTAAARSSGVEGLRLLCAAAVRQKRRQKAKGQSVRATTFITILSGPCVLGYRGSVNLRTRILRRIARRSEIFHVRGSLFHERHSKRYRAPSCSRSEI